MIIYFFANFVTVFYPITMRRIITILTLAILTYIAAGGVDINKMVLSGKRISTAEGLSSNTVYDLLQDRDGFIWMGASYGLCRYDGYSFANYYSLSSDKHKNVDANIGNLYQDEKNGLLWIHSSTFTFACYNLRTGKFEDYTNRNDESRSYRRFVMSDNDIWMFDTRSGVRHVAYENGTFKCTDYNNENGKLPDNHVPRLLVDKAYNVWILTDKGLLRIDRNGNIKTVVKNRKYIEATIYNGTIVCLAEDNRIEKYDTNGKRTKTFVIPSMFGAVKTIRSQFVWQNKWMLFSSSTYSIDLRTDRVSKDEDYQVQNGLLLDSVDGFYFESNSTGKLWIFPPKGNIKVMKLIPDMKFTAERRRKYNIKRGKDGLFYIASYGNGLFIYDHKNGAIRQFSAKDLRPVIDNNFLSAILIDRNGTIWVAQESMGISCISVSQQSIADFIVPAKDHKGDWANYVRMISKDKNGNIVFGTRDNKLYNMNLKTQSTTFLREMKAGAYAYLADKQGHTWIATRGDGLYVDDTNYTKWNKTPHIPSNDLYDIKEDCYGRIWIASYEDGLMMTRYVKGKPLKFHRFLYRNINESRLHQLEIDTKGRMWIASNNGIYVVDTRKKVITNNDFKCFNTKNGKFPFDEIRCIRYTSDGYLWAGGKGSGLVRCSLSGNLNTLTYRMLTDKEGIANNTISSILEDKYGDVWIATVNGLSRIYDKDMKVKTYQFGKAPERNIYSEVCAMPLADGRLLFGTQYGITVITPQRKYDSDNRSATEVHITDIKINGISTSDSCRFEYAPNYSDKISLPYNDNTISLSFSNFEYSNIESSLYQYYLEGMDKDWRPMTSVNHVEYGNLNPGTYTFHIRSVSDNNWSREKTLTIVIHQPWYNTLWAWMIYMAVIIAAGLYMYHNAREKLRLHQQMTLEKQLAEFKLNFFTNITHEFRTPLAIIQGAIDKLKQSDGQNASKAAIQTARRGTKRLLKLVNQLMEFRKVNTGNMKLNMEQGDIVEFIRTIYQDLWGLSKQKEMQTTFTPFAKSYEVAFDKQMVETMVYNLFSNAIKYTPERGTIAVTIKKQDEILTITVEDNGPGISEEQQSKLFQPFMQGYASQGGMGIGLYNAYQMAKLHKGSLAYSRVSADGGSRFTISLPADSSAYSKDDYKKVIAINQSKAEDDDEKYNEIIRELRPEAYNDLTIAIIEDDADMMDQIHGEMSVYFHVDTYTTGEAALEGITAKKPALVICDVMLPDMIGYNIVKNLKTNIDTAAIPVIMLTALDDETHQLRSYNAGADDYMVKPCNFRLLVGRAVQLIKNSRKHKELIEKAKGTAATLPPTTDTNEINLITSQADKNFISKMQMIITQHIADPDFTVDQLAIMLNMGRTKFFNKTKELTGISPNKYLQNERMRIAAELLKEGELTVSEVSYRIGIQDASYFNKCFKARYGETPSKYGKTVK